ncbi:MAG: AI-2E family transporter [Gammaproteobacteria bacterium]|nr:AI-2E family transporter [Gammaproteobacteria bacterium]
MELDNATFRKILSNDLMELMIRVGLIAFVVVMCVDIFTPFAGLMVWALILAVALYPLHRRLAQSLGGRQGRAATLLVVAGLLLIGVPTVMLSSSFAGHIYDKYSAFESHEITITQPDPAIADWPIVGKRTYKAWSAAANNLPKFLEEHKPELTNFSKYILSVAASTAGGIFMFLGSLIIAGIMMAYGESGSRSMLRIINRLSGADKGPRLHGLSTATIRSVATGVIGVAFIQALLLGTGFILAGIPAAGVLAFIVLLIGILQLPALLISLPAIGYLWGYGDASTMSNIVFTIYLVVAGFADNVLKPLLLGRGVDVPMPVILIGAMGGMVSAGIIGLFVGAVLLAVGYQVFMDWVANAEQETVAGDAETDASTQVPSAGT